MSPPRAARFTQSGTCRRAALLGRMASFSRLTGDNPPRCFCPLSGAAPGPSPFSSVAVALLIFSGDLTII